MMKRLFLALGVMAALGAPQEAQAEKYSEAFEAVRKDMNLRGDKALAGDRSALAELDQIYQQCRNDVSCTPAKNDWLRAAAAAANLGWFYWTKEGLGADRKNYGMYMYAEAARMGVPAGAYQVGNCVESACLPADLEKTYFADLFAFSSSKPWEGGTYERYKAASEIYRKGAVAGGAATAVAAANIESRILELSLPDLKYQTWDEQMIAKHRHMDFIVEMARLGLRSNPTDEQRTVLESRLNGYEPQLKWMKEAADSARARQQAQAVAASAPVAAPVSKGANYEADKARARDCIREREELDDWLNELRSWKRDLNAWDREIRDSSIDLQVAGGSGAAYAQHNANVDAYNAEGRDYSAEKRRHDQAADAHEARCKGSFNRAAIDEVCIGDAASSRFCKGFK